MQETEEVPIPETEYSSEATEEIFEFMRDNIDDITEGLGQLSKADNMLNQLEEHPSVDSIEAKDMCLRGSASLEVKIYAPTLESPITDLLKAIEWERVSIRYGIFEEGCDCSKCHEEQKEKFQVQLKLDLW